MTTLRGWWRETGLPLPTQADAIETAAAGGLVLLCLVLGVLAGRTIGQRLATAWKAHVANHAEGLGPRMCLIVRHGSCALALAIVANAYSWHAYAGVPIGLALGSATALFMHQLLRGVGIPRWASWLVAGILFVGLFSRAVGGLQPISDTLDLVGFNVGARRFSLLSLVTILIVSISLIAIVRLANRIIGHAIGRSNGLDATQKLLGQKIAAIAVVIAAFFIGIDLLGIDLTAFAVFSGAFGLAVGFGLQKTIGNLIAGIILLMDRSIKPGDVIVVGDSFGWVNKIGVRAVSVVTRDGKEHLIPNENLMTQEVENWSYTNRNVRVRIPVGVAYESDLRLAQELMLKAATDSPRVLNSPKPNVWLTSYGDYAVEHEILAWISDPESGVGNVKSDVLNRLWWMFKDNGIVVPVPRQEIYIRSRRED
ncbi:mechanosensitive ion channel [Sphingomonadaceae bacterium OTU29LAMAA1]|nr:mechanosensitive ion channel domain-containing protein [Sphingomonas sp. Leaf37]USU04698.1 mechanosensitive ion channel [Sphingomonadaceae bacterium OTU29LAMAA1]